MTIQKEGKKRINTSIGLQHAVDSEGWFDKSIEQPAKNAAKPMP